MTDIDFTVNKAPWTPRQVGHLMALQWNPNYHPFTCPNRGIDHDPYGLSDLGALIPTLNGWICQYCDYTQDWAYEFMLGEHP